MEILLKVVVDWGIIQLVNPIVLIISCYLMVKVNFLKVKETLYIIPGVTLLHQNSLLSWTGVKMLKNQGNQMPLASQKIKHISEETGLDQIVMVLVQVQPIWFHLEVVMSVLCLHAMVQRMGRGRYLIQKTRRT
ncbi:hypothetical protein CsSME_00041540 [Camellia sinensis var. sinensis]